MTMSDFVLTVAIVTGAVVIVTGGLTVAYRVCLRPSAPRCVHDWNTRVLAVARPKSRGQLGFSGHIDDDMLRKLLFGVTTTESICQKCGKRVVDESIGTPGDAHGTPSP